VEPQVSLLWSGSQWLLTFGNRTPVQPLWLTVPSNSLYPFLIRPPTWFTSPIASSVRGDVDTSPLNNGPAQRSLSTVAGRIYDIIRSMNVCMNTPYRDCGCRLVAILQHAPWHRMDLLAPSDSMYQTSPNRPSGLSAWCLGPTVAASPLLRTRSNGCPHPNSIPNLNCQVRRSDQKVRQAVIYSQIASLPLGGNLRQHVTQYTA
jgi:hypothetical protein